MKIVRYFRHLTGLEPTKDQKRLLKAAMKDPRILISAGRQSGKTIVVAVLVMWWMFESKLRPLRILLVSAQDNIVYYYVKRFFDAHPDMADDVIQKGRVYAVPQYGFSVLEGSELFVRGASERNIRGVPADIVIIDEACSVYDDSILTAMGNLSGTVSKFILLSTPHKLESLFAKWLREPQVHSFSVYQWSTEGLSWHTEDLMAVKRVEYSAARYAIEVLGRLPTSKELAISGDLIGTVVLGRWLEPKDETIVI